MNKGSNLIEVHVFRIVNSEMEFLILERSKVGIYPGLWQMVTGKIEDGEKAFETAVREIKEESDLNIEDLWVVPKINSFYSEDSDSIYQVPVFAAEVSSQTVIKLSKEHSSYKWVKYEEAIKAFAWEEQKNALKIFVDYYQNKKEYLDLLKITF